MQLLLNLCWLNAQVHEVYVCACVFRVVWHLQAFRRAVMPEPLDFRQWDAMSCAAEDLPAGPWHGCCISHCYSFLPNLRLNYRQTKDTQHQFTT